MTNSAVITAVIHNTHRKFRNITTAKTHFPCFIRSVVNNTSINFLNCPLLFLPQPVVFFCFTYCESHP